MKAVIMAGGLGTRLRPLTCQVPKPMVPVVNRPILEHIVLLLKKHKIKDILLLLYHLPQSIQNHFGDGSRFGVRIDYLIPNADYGTAGAVKQAAARMKDSFLVVSGDVITDLDLTRFLQFHREKAGLISIALSRVTNPAPFGIVITDKDGKVNRFLEKPSWGEIFSDTVNTGIYALHPRALKFIPEDKEYYFARDLFPTLVAENRAIYGFNGGCYWKDVGDLDTYRQVHWDWFAGQIDLDAEEDHQNGIWLGRNCTIAKSANLEPPVLVGDNCQIESGAHLRNCVIGNGCYVGRNATLFDSILWEKVSVHRHAELSKSVVGAKTELGESSYLQENVILSNNVFIGANCHINSNVKIWPDKEVDSGSVVNSSLVWGDKWHREIFTDSRVTGLANFEITPEFASKLGTAFGAWLGKKGLVVVSRDASSAARMSDRAIMCGLMSTGVDVHDLRVIPIPVVRYILHSGKYNGGVHVRRSPFDKKLLDLVFFDRNGRDLSASVTKSIERTFFREDFPRAPFDEIGEIDFPVRVPESYEQDFVKHLNVSAINSAKFRVVIDYSYGAATQVFPTILGALDCEVISLNAFLNPEKLTRTEKNFNQALKQLAKIVLSTEADIGFLIDAGAEKLFVVDEKGRILLSERLSVLVTKLYLDLHRPKKIAVPVSSPSQVVQMAQKRGVQVIHTAEDGGSIIKATEDPEVRYACGTQGGFIFADFHFAFDGLFALAKILELIAASGKRLGQLNDETPARFGSIETVACPWEAKGQVMRRMTEYSENKDRMLIDGVKLFYDADWVLVIPDRDKPFFRVIVEAGTEKRTRALAERYKKKIERWTKSFKPAN